MPCAGADESSIKPGIVREGLRQHPANGIAENRQFDGFEQGINKLQAKTVIFDGFDRPVPPWFLAEYVRAFKGADGTSLHPFKLACVPA